MSRSHRIWPVCLVLFALGCSQNQSPSAPKATASPAVLAEADQKIAKWPSAGMWLPDNNEIRFFRDHFTETRPKLESALSAEDEKVRQRAAYVIEKFSTGAQPCVPKLCEQLKKEPKRLVRMYLYATLAAAQSNDPDVIAELKRRFDNLSAENLPSLDQNNEYAEVDEKIEVASTLYVLVPPAEKQLYLDFVQRWLREPEPGIDVTQLSSYWDHRWIAVVSSRRMHGADSSIPMLKAMLKERNAKMWVSTQVPETLKSLGK